MTFGVDLSAVASPGTLRYTEHLVPAMLRELRAEEDLTLYVNRAAGEVIGPGSKGLRLVFVPSWVTGAKTRLLWGQWQLPRRFRRDGVDVAFAPFDISPLRTAVPMVVGVRNPMPLRVTSDETADASFAIRRRVHERLTSASVKRAVFASYPTAFAAKYLGALQEVPSAKRRVVHHGVDYEYWSTRKASEPKQRFGFDGRPYFLYVSQYYSYKNPVLTVESFLRFRQRNPEIIAGLILTGDCSATPSGREAVQRARDSSLRDFILFTGLVDRDSLRTLYQNAVGLLMLTSLETFGHPFVEAMAAGTPVIRLESEFGEEICGSGSVVSGGADCEAVCAAMERVMLDLEFRAGVVRAAEARVRTFSWDREASETLDLLREAYRVSAEAVNDEGTGA